MAVTPQNAWGDTDGRPIAVTGIAQASYAAGKVIGASFEIPNANNGSDKGFMITDQQIFVGGIAAAPNIDLFLFGSDPGLADNAAGPLLDACVGLVDNAYFYWGQGAARSGSLYDYVGRALVVLSRRIAKASLYGCLVSRATQTFPQGAGLVTVLVGMSRD